MVDVCAFYTPLGGGVRTYIDQKLRAAPAMGHELVVIAPGKRDEVVQVGKGTILATIAAPPLPFDSRYRYFNDQARLHRELDRWKPDHLDASSPWSSASMVARWQGPATRALTLHCDPLATHAYRWLGGILPRRVIDRMFARFWSHLRTLDRMFDLIVTPSSGYRQRLIAGGLHKVRTIGFGVEPGRFSPDLRDEALRRDLLSGLGLEPSATLLVGLGRLSPEKRWTMVIDAGARAAAERPMGLLIVGSGRHSARIEAACRRYSNIAAVGQMSDRTDLARLLASADALVHGCESETFGLAVSEAQASGIPIIAPNSGGAGEQLARGAGIAYRAGCERSLTRALLSFVECGPAAQRRLAVRACAVRTMDEHFAELFASYAAIAPKPVLCPLSRSNKPEPAVGAALRSHG